MMGEKKILWKAKRYYNDGRKENTMIDVKKYNDGQKKVNTMMDKKAIQWWAKRKYNDEEKVHRYWDYNWVYMLFSEPFNDMREKWNDLNNLN